MRKIVLLLIIFLIISSISAQCNEGQININTASSEELDKLSGIGPVKAQAIIDSRPFDSIDNLIDVSGIGEATLNKIKSQGLVCVDAEENEKEKEETQINTKENTNLSYIEEEVKEDVKIEDSFRKIELTTIELNPKDIKSENNSENLKGNYAIYGFIAFSILIGALLMLRKNKYKNEFR